MKNQNMNFTKKIIGFVCEKWLMIKHYATEEERLNKLVETEISERNIQKIKLLQFTAILINSVLIFSFAYLFDPVTVMAEKWRNGVILVHLVSAIAVALITVLLIINSKKENPALGTRIIENSFIVYVVSFGFAIIFVDLPRTANIVPFLIVCVVIGAFVLKKPIFIVIQYLVSYVIFFNIIGINEKDAMALITNRVNGFVFVIIGTFMAIILWQSERNNILQKRKINEQQQKLESAAYYDDLTGLINRRKWIEFLNDEFERMKRYKHKSSILSRISSKSIEI
ncbi:MAG: GGDEF domain-containing protein [Acetobacterium sp.]|nr:GGDEF domain-containing protein [Acetobacterium sp.]